MTTFAALYALGFCALSIFSLRRQVKRREPFWYIVLDSSANVIILILFLSYLAKDALRSFSLLAPCLFLLSWGWAILQTPHEIRRGLDEMESDEERRIYVRFYLPIEIMFLLPAFWFGGLASLRVFR